MSWSANYRVRNVSGENFVGAFRDAARAAEEHFGAQWGKAEREQFTSAQATAVDQARRLAWLAGVDLASVDYYVQVNGHAQAGGPGNSVGVYVSMLAREGAG